MTGKKKAIILFPVIPFFLPWQKRKKVKERKSKE
jgi:hypothetical protein